MFAIWQMDSGRIVAHNLSSYEYAELNCMYPGEVPIEGLLHCDRHWVVQEGEDPPYATDRPRLLAQDGYAFKADGEEGISLTDVPAGTAFRLADWTTRESRHSRVDGVIDDGELELKSTIAKVYRLILDPPFPWQRQDVEVIFNG